ncbi:MAG: RHS repeat-associated core domain-containing protein, partial [Gemmatimonadetes bacterium]|nr:RHS repeat-associated core domain-containing protein [Gemmatimonadota bacterium]
RRVWRQMIRDTANRICTAQDKSSGCRNEVSRTVWDGDQVLYDVKIAADTIGEASEGYPTNATFTGGVGYTHAGGIDTPLDLFKGTDIVLPYADYRGQFDKGTCPGTACSNAYYFPGNGSSAFEEPPTPANGPPSWYGELITGMADGSGYQYKRNRYFNPPSGQFTQEDPIGLAGGLNAYGFGGGDPIGFRDPMGTCRVRVGYTSVIGLWRHAFIEITPPDATNTSNQEPTRIAEGGPEQKESNATAGGSAGSASGSSSGGGARGTQGGEPVSKDNSSVNRENTPFGRVIASVRTGTKEGVVEWDAPLVQDEGPCDLFIEQFEQTASRIKGAKKAYSPLGLNSNAVVNDMLREAHLGGLRRNWRAISWDRRITSP